MMTAPDPHPRKPQFAAPKGAADCHFHVFDPPYPKSAETDYQKMASTLGLQRGVVVQASTQEMDPQRVFKALQQLGPHFRCIGGADVSLSAKVLAEYKQQGMVGARINWRSEVQFKWEEIAAYAKRIEPLQWHLDFYILPEQLHAWASNMAQLPIPFVLDHFGMLKASDSPTALLKLIDTGKCWVKLSAPYRISKQPLPYSDLLPLAQKLIKHAPERMLWASDWPHMRFEGMMPNDGDLLDLLRSWAGPETKRILVDNPKTLYGFMEY